MKTFKDILTANALLYADKTSFIFKDQKIHSNKQMIGSTA